MKTNHPWLFRRICVHIYVMTQKMIIQLIKPQNWGLEREPCALWELIGGSVLWNRNGERTRKGPPQPRCLAFLLQTSSGHSDPTSFRFWGTNKSWLKTHFTRLNMWETDRMSLIEDKSFWKVWSSASSIVFFVPTSWQMLAALCAIEE